MHHIRHGVHCNCRITERNQPANRHSQTTNEPCMHVAGQTLEVHSNKCTSARWQGITTRACMHVTGQTLEMHGNIHELVCPECGAVSEVTPQHVRTIRAKRALRCGQCGDADLRCRVMLYDDGEGQPQPSMDDMVYG